MSNILLVEPDYRSKFPPLGLLRIGSYHRDIGDSVTFARGRVKTLRDLRWHRIYVSSLFTYELPRTVATAQYYLQSVDDPGNLFVGGIGATLMPGFIRESIPCTVVEGPLDRPGMLGKGTPALADYVPDYGLLSSVDWDYQPKDAYFCRMTRGCIRNCKFCAVPRIEPTFGPCADLSQQISEVRKRFGEKRNLVILDNNILALPDFGNVAAQIRQAGFERGTLFNRKQRTIDFNQGIDARLVTPDIANTLSTLPVSPIRLAFDHDSMREPYVRAIRLLSNAGFNEFTNYVMFNFDDDPASLYRRLSVNIELSSELGIRVTGFPMRYVPIDDITRAYISPSWRWRYLRGIQCILLATHGLVSPNPEFFFAAFGRNCDEFLEIISMPDRYIIHRNEHKDKGAAEWRTLYRSLAGSEREELVEILHALHVSEDLEQEVKRHKKYAALLEHYYPGGKAVRDDAEAENENNRS